MGSFGTSHCAKGKTERRSCIPLMNLHELELPISQWARVAFEQGAVEWLRRIALKNKDWNSVPLLNGPGGYM
eukprot:12407194-Karenia_brevis.AAC.1